MKQPIPLATRARPMGVTVKETKRFQPEGFQKIVQEDQGAASHQGYGSAEDGGKPDGHEELAQRDLHGLADALDGRQKKGRGADVLHEA